MKLKNRNIIIVSISGLMLILFVLIFLTVNNQRKIKAKNIAISNQKDEIEAQAYELESSLDNIKSLTKFKDELTQMLVHYLKNPISNIIKFVKIYKTKWRN